MATKFKVISISIALFLIAALSVALVFALPKEEFNLSGNLSYEPSYQGYEVCKSFLDPEGNSYVRVYDDGRVEVQVCYSSSYLVNLNQKYEGIISGGMLLATSGEGGFEHIFSGETFSAPADVTGVFTVLSAGLYFVNENFIYGGNHDIYFIKEGLDLEEIVFVGYPETNAISGYDLALPIQTSNLEGDSLKNALVGGSAGINRSIYVFNGYTGERVAIADITFGTFDQTTGGIKTVEISFANPFNSEQTLTEEIKILVYEDEEEITHYQISGADGTRRFEIPPMPAGTTVEDLVSVCNAQTTKLRYEKYLADNRDDSGSENIETITADMISDFKIEGERGSCKLTYKQAEVYLQFEVYQEAQYKTNADQTMAYVMMTIWDSTQTGVDPLSSLSAYLVSDESVTFERVDLVVEYFVDGALTTFDEIISTGGVKNYQIRVSLQNGTLVEEVDMSTFVYNSQNRFPTSFTNVGFNRGSIPLLEDGSLDLEGKYIRVCYNGNSVEVGQEAGFTEGVDYEDIYLTDERVNLVYYIQDGAMVIRAVYITFDLGGQTFDFLAWTAFK